LRIIVGAVQHLEYDKTHQISAALK